MHSNVSIDPMLSSHWTARLCSIGKVHNHLILSGLSSCKKAVNILLVIFITFYFRLTAGGRMILHL